MGDSLAQAALILVHLNLFSSTANWDLGPGRRTPSCVCMFSVIPRVERGCVSLFKQCTLIIPKNRVKKKKKSNTYKAGEAKEHEQPSWYNTAKSANDELQKRWSLRVATTAFEPDTCGRMNRQGEEYCSSDTYPVDRAATVCQCGKSTNGTNHLTLVWQNSC